MKLHIVKNMSSDMCAELYDELPVITRRPAMKTEEEYERYEHRKEQRRKARNLEVLRALKHEAYDNE